KEKRKNNIAEYILYMWQIEDMLRAYNFRLDNIEKELIPQYQGSEEQTKELTNWYSGLAESMLSEGLRNKGHLQILDSLTEELNDFHFRLIDSSHQPEYQKKYLSNINNISELRNRMGNKEKITDMEVCLTALYGLLLMRLKKKEISKETEEIISGFSELLADLSQLFKKYEEGQIEI
ncbi:MAG: DUF4924 family protein, partial [Bacteroidetes bacterium]|nr:DUF4924 family protein [Bacteroidota bacterium]